MIWWSKKYLRCENLTWEMKELVRSVSMCQFQHCIPALLNCVGEELQHRGKIKGATLHFSFLKNRSCQNSIGIQLFSGQVFSHLKVKYSLNRFNWLILDPFHAWVDHSPSIWEKFETASRMSKISGRKFLLRVESRQSVVHSELF